MNINITQNVLKFYVPKLNGHYVSSSYYAKCQSIKTLLYIIYNIYESDLFIREIIIKFKTFLRADHILLRLSHFKPS